MDAVYLSWLAGFFDGEGSVTVYLRTERRGRPTNSLLCRLYLTNTDRTVLDEVAAHFGGRVVLMSKRNGYQQCFQYEVTGKNSETLATAILPYTKVKREQVEIYLEARALLAGPRDLQSPLSPERAAARQRVATQAALLKGRPLKVVI